MLCHPAQERDNFICRYCGKDGLASLDNWHDSAVDHIQPLSHGGRRELDNEVARCNYCNSIKGDRLFLSAGEAKEYVLKRRQELRSDYEKVLAEIRRRKPEP